MSRLWLLAVVLSAAIGLSSSALAQTAPLPPNTIPYTGGYIATVAGMDPYAISSGPSSTSWLGNGFSFPSFRDRTRDRFWLRTDYLIWWTSGMDVPPLATTSPPGTPQNQAAVLGESDTSILFGGRSINSDSSDGIRVQSGAWLRDGAFALESEFVELSSQRDSFVGGSDGSAILGQPFFDILNGQETAQLVSFPNLVAGNLQIASKSKLRSFMINGRASLIPVINPGEGCQQADRVDTIFGYRYLKLEDGLGFAQNLTSLVPTAPGTVAIAEGFQTTNTFNGFQLGALYRANFQRAWLESMLRIALGNTKQRVTISGGTAITELGVTDTFVGGVYAQRTNIGNYRRDVFSMVPEVGLTAGLRVTDCFYATIGYSVIYFPNVVRAGDQIDRQVNPNLIPEEVSPFSGPLRPRFSFVETDYWAHGLNLGAEFRF